MAAPWLVGSLTLGTARGKRHDFRFASRPPGRPGTHTLLADAVHYISLLELCRGAARESQEPCLCTAGAAAQTRIQFASVG